MVLCTVPATTTAIASKLYKTEHEPQKKQSQVAGSFPTDLEDTAKFFAAQPHLIPQVKAVLAKYATNMWHRSDARDEEHNRSVVDHFRTTENIPTEFDAMEPFYTIDLGKVVTQMAKFRKHLPMVQPHYAVKCNPHPALLEMIAALGGSYDCASQEEFETVLKLGLVPDAAKDIIFANPCKQPTHIRAANKASVQMVTFDDVAELYKLKKDWPKAQCVLRIRTEDSAAVCQFSSKFGARMSLVPTLIETVKKLDLDLYGVSFHVGSGNSDPMAYLGAIRNARRVFDIAAGYGYNLQLLDIGGGLPGHPPTDPKSTELTFEEICEHVRPELAKLFPNTRIIAEPGRFFAASTYMLAFNVFSKRSIPLDGAEKSPEELQADELEHQYFMNDGLYHSFNAIVFDHQHPELFFANPEEAGSLVTATIFGPTCDSLDCILKRHPFPRMDIGTWLFVPNFGAYTAATASPFNGFVTRRTEFICTVPFDEAEL